MTRPSGGEGPSPSPVDVGPFATPEAAALAWCVYTQGPVPHWLLHEELAPILVPRERAVLAELAADAEEAAGTFLPRQRAVLRFIHDGTQCHIDRTLPGNGADQRQVAVTQKVPLIIEPNERLGLTDSMSAAEQEAVWLAAFERSFEDEFRTAPFSIRVEREGSHWFVDARLDALYAAPRRADQTLQSAQDAIERREWPAAIEAVERGCEIAAEDTRCPELRTIAERARTHQVAIAPVLQATRASDPSVRGQVLGGSAVVPVLEVTIHNDSAHTIDSVWVLATDASDQSATCRLYAAAPPDDAVAVSVPAGGSATGYCRLPQGLSGPVRVAVRDVVVEALAADPGPPPRDALDYPVHDH